jgi:ABC-2 type transport system permease protein
MLISPMPNYLILLGFVAGGVARGLAVGVVVTIISLLFADNLRIEHGLITVAIVFLTSVLFALGGFINAVYAQSFDDISIIPTFVLTPLTYLGGVFYSIHMLPGFWQQVSMANPILYMVNAFRYGIVGYSDIDIKTSFALTLMFILALYLFSLRLLNKGVGIRS